MNRDILYSLRLIKTPATLRRFFCLTILALTAAPTSAATNEDSLIVDYMPFLNGRPWPRVPVIAYLESVPRKGRSNIWVHPSAPKNFPTIKEVGDEDSDFATIVLTLPDGSKFKTYNALVLGPYVGAVYSGDFNNDGIPDFMIFKPGSGNGLGGEYCFGVFAFSEGKGYRFTRIRTMGLGPQNLVVDPATRSFYFIHTSFRQGQTLDGSDHSFWVHRFFKWDGSAFREDSKFAPVWIQYTNRPNHEPTKLLTPALKIKIWAEEPESASQIEW